MTITAKRFNSLDKVTNLPITEFFTIDNLNTLNDSITELLSIKNKLEPLIKNLGLSTITSTINSIVGDTGLDRITKDIGTSLKDISGLASSSISDLYNNTIGGGTGLLSDIGQLTNSAQQLVSGTITSTEGLLNTVGLGSITQKMHGGLNEITKISNVIDGFTNGNYKIDISNATGICNSITGICAAANSVGLPLPFSKITSGISNVNTILNSGSAVIDKMSKIGNNEGILDVLSVQSFKDAILPYNPEIAGVISKGYSAGSNTINALGETINHFNTFKDKITSIAPDWCTGNNGVVSAKNIVPNSDYAKELKVDTIRNNTTGYVFDNTPTLSIDQILTAVL